MRFLENGEVKALLDGLEKVWTRVSPPQTAEREPEPAAQRTAQPDSVRYDAPPRVPRWFTVV